MTTRHQPGPLLAGRVAVVTGGAGGIGRAISEAFAVHGARVVVADVDRGRTVDTVAAIRTAGGDADEWVGDVTVPARMAELATAAGPVDVLVNNVGHYLHRAEDFVDTTPEQWDELYRVNLLHVFTGCHTFVPGMLERGRGSVINVSTVEAFRGAPRRAVYTAFKAAITGFTRTLALEVGNGGVRVNAIAPDLTQSLQVPYDKWIPAEQQHLIPTWVPVGRFGQPDDLAGIALFLASDLSAFVTGTTVHADGGSLAAGGWFRSPGRGGWTNRPLDP